MNSRIKSDVGCYVAMLQMREEYAGALHEGHIIEIITAYLPIYSA